jgi:SOS response regulatory protein OraA/RecX
MRVLRSTGEPSGTITGTLALHSEDPVLRAAYKKAMRDIKDTDPDAEERLQEFLISRGFKIQ